jgi:hypothetical protein
MAALQTLLDRADSAAGTEGAARAWLLLLLKQAETGSQPASAADPRPPEQPAEPAVASASPLQPPATMAEAPTAMAEAPAPKAEAPTAMKQEGLPEGRESITPPTLESPPAPSSPPPLARASTSEALDQAFAPLEIAFPPLPLPEPPAERASSPDATSAPPPLRDSSPFQAFQGQPTTAGTGEETSDHQTPPGIEEFSARLATKGPREPLEGLRGASGMPVSRDRKHPVTPDPQNAPSQRLDIAARQDVSTGGPAGQPEVSAPPAPGLPMSEEPAHRLEDFSTAVAAPVPSFHVDALEGWASVESRKRPEPQIPADEEAPAARAKSLQGWRAWLPGAFRSRSRS